MNQEAVDDWEQKHGFPWPNCDVPDCEYKVCWPSKFCYRHTDAETLQVIRPDLDK